MFGLQVQPLKHISLTEEENRAARISVMVTKNKKGIPVEDGDGEESDHEAVRDPGHDGEEENNVRPRALIHRKQNPHLDKHTI